MYIIERANLSSQIMLFFLFPWGPIYATIPSGNSHSFFFFGYKQFCKIALTSVMNDSCLKLTFKMIMSFRSGC